MDKKSLGTFGEELACRFLRRKSYKILEQNFSSRFGEIDIIASDGKFVVFVEVKLRKNADFAQAREFVNFSKQRKIISTASLWLSQYKCELQPRFDVIEIYAVEGTSTRRPQINHIEDAFQ